MNTNINEFYKNKTWKYLVPCLFKYGKTFIYYFNIINKLAFGIYDTEDWLSNFGERNIFILIQKNKIVFLTKKFLEWIRHQEFYNGDYPVKNNNHMIIIKIPKEYHNAYDHFLKGKYSKMYTSKEKKELFLNKGKIDEYKILNKDKKELKNFINRIENIFNVNIKENDLKDAEIDFPLVIKEEIFNPKNKNKIYLKS